MSSRQLDVFDPAGTEPSDPSAVHTTQSHAYLESVISSSSSQPTSDPLLIPTGSAGTGTSPSPTSPASNGYDTQVCGCANVNQADYRGSIHTTKRGKECVPWNSESIEQYPYAGLENNHCRNPDDDDSGPWCFTDNGGFGYCDVPDCLEEHCFPPPRTSFTPPACYGADPQVCGCGNVRQADYRGSKNITENGDECVRWDSLEFYDKLIEMHPYGGFENNYCRYADGYFGKIDSSFRETHAAFCYIAGSDSRHLCDVPYCSIPPRTSCLLDPSSEYSIFEEELEYACDYHTCVETVIGNSPDQDDIEAAENLCVCPYEIWENLYGGRSRFSPDPEEEELLDCCYRERASNWTTASCECSVKAYCKQGYATQCHIYAEHCCDDDDECRLDYQSRACNVALKTGLDWYYLYACYPFEEARCGDDFDLGGCRCDFWNNLCFEHLNHDGTCYTAADNCCGDENYHCRCDYLTFATDVLGYYDPERQKDDVCPFASDTRSSTTELEALRGIFIVTGGDNWNVSTGWMTEQNHCKWHGITCNDEGYVTRVELRGNNVTGKFPANLLSQLHKLETLDLADNGLFGFMAGTTETWDTEIWDIFLANDTSLFSNLRKLTDVDLSRNKLSGEVDVLFAPSLQHVNFTHNEFTSIKRFLSFKPSHRTLLTCDLSKNSIKEEVSSVLTNVPSNLEELILSGNDIQGTFPTSLEPAESLRRLYLDSNAISGKLPDFSKAIPKLQELNLSNQKREGNKGLTGKVRPSLSKLLRLTLLNLAGNSLTGAIPPEIGNLALLEMLDLSNNELSETIPPQLGKLGGTIKVINLSNNTLEGKISAKLGSLDEDEESEEAALLLSGNLGIESPAPLKLCFFDGFDRKDDPELCPPERTALKEFYDSAKGQEWTKNDGWGNSFKSHCEWFGVVCNNMNHAVELNLTSNGLSGTLSKYIANLTSLKILDLSDNDINGDIPAEIAKLTKLKRLRLSYNSFDGGDTNFGEDMHQLEFIHVQGNRLFGSIPDVQFLSRKDNSFISDCGNPSEYEDSLVCNVCTMCCNANEDCYPTVQKMDLDSYEELAGVFFACLFVAYGLFVIAIIAIDKCKSNKDHDPTASVARRPSEIAKDMKYALETIGDDSVNQFLLTTSWAGWAICLAVMAAQIWMLWSFVVGAEVELSKDNTDLVYSWKCPRDTDECRNTTDWTLGGWCAFVILMAAHLLKDLISGTKLLVLSGKDGQPKHTRIKFFVGGWLLNSVTAFSLFVSVIYNQAIATSDTELIMNAVVILFVCDIDEMFYEVLVAIHPSWVESITSLDQEEVDSDQQDKQDEDSCLEAGSNPNNQDPGMQDQPTPVQAIDGEVQRLKGTVETLKETVETLQETVEHQKEENAELMQLLRSKSHGI